MAVVEEDKVRSEVGMKHELESAARHSGHGKRLRNKNNAGFLSVLGGENMMDRKFDDEVKDAGLNA